MKAVYPAYRISLGHEWHMLVPLRASNRLCHFQRQVYSDQVD
jgi:hypothetical protein